MSFVKKCPICGGEVREKEVTEVLTGGKNTTFIKLKAGVCLHCGDRLFSSDTIKQFEEIETKLKKQKTIAQRFLSRRSLDEGGPYRICRL